MKQETKDKFGILAIITYFITGVAIMIYTIVIIVRGPSRSAEIDRFYPKAAIVIQVDSERCSELKLCLNHDLDEIMIEDCIGGIWVYQGADDWCEGDVAALIMDNNGTPSIYDDKIVKITYSGI